MVQGLSEEWSYAVHLHNCQVIQLKGGGEGAVLQPQMLTRQVHMPEFSSGDRKTATESVHD